MRKINIMVTLGCVALAGCSLLFNGDKYEGDAGGRDAGIPPCDDSPTGGDECCSADDCTGTGETLCGYDAMSEQWSCVERCDEDLDCWNHPGGPTCRNDGQCGCSEDANCVDRQSGHACIDLLCGCESNDDCDDGDGCDSSGICQPCDADGDSFKIAACESNPTMVDCDDTNENTYPGAPPMCGSMRHEDCMAGWRQLEGAIGAGEIGVSEVLVGDLPMGMSTQLSIAALGGGAFLGAIMTSAGPRLFRQSTDDSIEVLDNVPSSGNCPTSSVHITNVQAIRIARAARGTLMLALAGETGDGDRDHALALLERPAEATEWMSQCKQYSGTSPAGAQAVALAPDAGIAAVLWARAIGSADSFLQVVPRDGGPAAGHMVTRPAGPPFLASSGRLIGGVGAGAGTPGIIPFLLDDDAAPTSLAPAASSLMDTSGPGALAHNGSGNFLYILGSTFGTRITQGTCTSSGGGGFTCAAPPPMEQSLASRDWPGVAQGRYALLTMNDTRALVAYVGRAPSRVSDEVRIGSLLFTEMIESSASFTPLRNGRPGSTPMPGAHISEVAVDGTGDEIIVAYIAEDGLSSQLVVQIIKICATE